MTILSVQCNLGNKSNWKHQNTIRVNIVYRTKMFIFYLLYCCKRKHWNNCPHNCFFYCYWIPRILTTERKGWYFAFSWPLPLYTFTDDEYWQNLLIKRDSIYLMSQQAIGTVGHYCLRLLHGRKVEFLPSWLWKRACTVAPSVFQLQEKNEKIQNICLFFTSWCWTVCLLAEEGGSNSRLKMFIAAWFASKIIFNILHSKNIDNSAEFIEWQVLKGSSHFTLNCKKSYSWRTVFSIALFRYTSHLFAKGLNSSFGEHWGVHPRERGREGRCSTLAGARPRGPGDTYPEHESACCKALLQCCAGFCSWVRGHQLPLIMVEKGNPTSKTKSGSHGDFWIFNSTSVERLEKEATAFAPYRFSLVNGVIKKRRLLTAARKGQ